MSILPLAYAAIAYGAVWALRLGGWNSELVVLVTQRFGLRGMPLWGAFTLWLLFTATAEMIRGMSTALGEEIGWRGFLVPELAKHFSDARSIKDERDSRAWRDGFTITALIFGRG
ncbi:MAG TPA: hypothetical protein VF845_09390 [Terriglobales bacterium]